MRFTGVGPKVTCGSALRSVRVRANYRCIGIDRVEVRGQLLDIQRNRSRAGSLAQRVPAAHVDWHPATQIGEREICLPITPISRAQQGEESLILVNRQELAVAEGPSLWREVKTNNLNFR